MKKISIITMVVLMSMGMFSCNIAIERPNTGTVTIILEEIPDDIKAVSIWCNANNWKAAEVNGSSVYIKPVSGGKVKFELIGYVLSETLQFQLTPMPAIDTKLGDDWWSYAISGSSNYGNDKNNIVCKNMIGNTTLTLNSNVYGGWKADNWPCYGVNSNRWYAPGKTWGSCYSRK